MNTRRLFGYTLRPDGRYYKRVEFDVPGRPQYINVVYIVRNRHGELMRSKRGTFVTKTS